MASRLTFFKEGDASMRALVVRERTYGDDQDWFTGSSGITITTPRPVHTKEDGKKINDEIVSRSMHTSLR